MTTDQLTALLTADPAAVIESDRRFYYKQIMQAADIIAANATKRPVILLSGPSGSGKTTTALLIERELERRGMEMHTLSMDEYFSPLTEEEKELLRLNKLDLEKPTRVDIPFFQQQLGQILNGEEILLPRYDFRESKRVFDGRKLRRKPGELVIMEGIMRSTPRSRAMPNRQRESMSVSVHALPQRTARCCIRQRSGWHAVCFVTAPAEAVR